MTAPATSAIRTATDDEIASVEEQLRLLFIRVRAAGGGGSRGAPRSAAHRLQDHRRIVTRAHARAHPRRGPRDRQERAQPPVKQLEELGLAERARSRRRAISIDRAHADRAIERSATRFAKAAAALFSLRAWSSGSRPARDPARAAHGRRRRARGGAAAGVSPSWTSAGLAGRRRHPFTPRESGPREGRATEARHRPLRRPPAAYGEPGRAGLARHVDRAVVRLDDRSHDRESEPGAARAPRARGVAAGEPLEERADELGRDAGAVVGRPRARRRRRRVRAAATTLVPSGVCTRAFASRLVTTWRSRGSSPATTVAASGSRTSQSWPGPAACASPTASTSTRLEVDGLGGELATLVEAGEQQQVLDELGHAHRLRLDAADRVHHVGRQLAAVHSRELGVAADRRERGAEFVGGVGDEAAHLLLALLASRERGCHVPEHAVERGAEPPDLGALVVVGDALGERRRRRGRAGSSETACAVAVTRRAERARGRTTSQPSDEREHEPGEPRRSRR